ncbi:MAG: bacteriohemerythrin [Sideroxyarcus sp.]|nr:bacteriohemerythrin [Sideroxyarcus sp.]
MSKFIWTEQFKLGIEVIDQQHRQIMDYVNQLEDALGNGKPQKVVSKLIATLVDYTIFHFGFEEDLLEKAGYPYLKPHQKSHATFAKRIADFRDRYDAGEDVSKDVDALLSMWAFDHLKHDDSDYVGVVVEFLRQNPNYFSKKPGVFARLFK